MDQFFHIRIIIGMVLGLGITLILKGLSKFIQHPGRYKVYSVHIAWSIYVFMMLTHFWWWEFHLAYVEVWTFTHYAFVILYIVIYFLLCAILFPDDIDDYPGFKDYYYSRRSWFFGLLILILLVDVGDTWLKGKEYLEHLGTEYFLRTAFLLVLSGLAIKIRSERFHMVVVAIFILYEILWTLRMYMTLQ
ncbi:MAG: hypothetical protein HOP08_19995 [Cyclobacteriaceae bacterium]|nr:hypothetical protein [Cyclobacteriaceae bacterium]